MTKGEDTRSHILERALALSSRLGLEGLSIGALAKDVGMTKSGLYAHFDSKEALQIAVLDTAREAFVAQVAMPALKGPRGRPRIASMFDGWMNWGRGEKLPGGCPFVAAAADFDDRPGRVRDVLVTHQKELVGLLMKSASGAVEEGHFRPDVNSLRFSQETLGIVLAYYHFSHLLGYGEAEANARAAFDRLLADAALSA
jgi:AcrR family transcriptional regulator